MASCSQAHRNDPYFAQFPKDQGDFSRHRCAGCAYELGYHAGYAKKTRLDLQADIMSIPKSQASHVRHISPMAAYAQGYVDGISQYYRQHPEKN